MAFHTKMLWQRGTQLTVRVRKSIEPAFAATLNTLAKQHKQKARNHNQQPDQKIPTVTCMRGHLTVPQPMHKSMSRITARHAEQHDSCRAI